jgi:hypothetical protein
MQERKSWKTKCRAELQQAELARVKGNEGMARVCARRAAGHVIRRYYATHGVPPPAAGAYQLLRTLSKDTGVSDEVRQTAHLFTIPITLEHELPVNTDLIANVSWLAKELLGESLSAR